MSFNLNRNQRTTMENYNRMSPYTHQNDCCKTYRAQSWRGYGKPETHILFLVLYIDRVSFENCQALSSKVNQIHPPNPISDYLKYSHMPQSHIQEYLQEMCTRMFSFICNKQKLEKTQIFICTKGAKQYVHTIFLCISLHTSRKILKYSYMQ